MSGPNDRNTTNYSKITFGITSNILKGATNKLNLKNKRKSEGSNAEGGSATVLNPLVVLQATHGSIPMLGPWTCKVLVCTGVSQKVLRVVVPFLFLLQCSFLLFLQGILLAFGNLQAHFHVFVDPFFESVFWIDILLISIGMLATSSCLPVFFELAQ
jgi:hypothetical protein